MTSEKETQTFLTADQAKVILQFLQRTNLQGSEMPAYVDVFNALSTIAGLSGATSANET